MHKQIDDPSGIQKELYIFLTSGLAGPHGNNKTAGGPRGADSFRVLDN